MAQVDRSETIHQQELAENTAVTVGAFRETIEAVGIAMEDLANTVAEQQHEPQNEQVQPVEQYDNVDPVVVPVVEEQNEFQVEAQPETEVQVEAPIETQVEAPIEAPPETQIEVQVEAPIETQIETQVDTPIESRVEENESRTEEPKLTEDNEQSCLGEVVVIPVINDPESIPVSEAPKAEPETVDESSEVIAQASVDQEGEQEGEEKLSDSEENADIEEYYRQAQNEEYGDDDLEDVSLYDQDSLDACSDTSSQKIKKVGRVRQGFKQVFGGTKQIFVGSGKNIKKGTSRAATTGRDTIKGGANFIADTATSAADSTINATKSVAGAIKDGTVSVAKATAGAVSDVASGTKEVVTTGLCLGVGVTVLGAQAIGRGTTAVAGAIKDGTVSAATSIADGAKSAGGAVVDGVKYTGSTIANTASDIAHAGKDAVGDVLDTGKAGVRAVEHGIENVAMKTAASIQQNTVKALTLGLKMADGSLAVVPKAIEAPAPSQAIEASEQPQSNEAPISQEAICLPPPENN